MKIKKITLLKKILIFVFIYFIFHSYECYSDGTYPYTFQLYQKIDGGKLFVLKNDTLPEKYISYLIKPNWLEDTEIFQIWEGIEKKISRGTSITNAHILDVTSYNSLLLSVWSEENKTFVALINKNGEIISITQLTKEFNRYTTPSARWLGKISNTTYLLLVENTLFTININDKNSLSFDLISNNVIDATPLKYGNTNYSIAILIKQGAITFINIYSKDGKEKQIFKSYQVSDNSKILKSKNKIALISQISDRLCNASIIDLNTYETKNIWLNTSINTIEVCNSLLYYLIRNEKGYSISIINLENEKFIRSIQISENFIEPLKLQAVNDCDLIVFLFKNGILTINKEHKINSSDIIPTSEFISQIPTMYFLDEFLIISDNYTSLVFKYNYNDFWYLTKFYKSSGKYLIPSAFVIIILILYQLYRHKKRLFNELLNVPSVGAVIITDKIGRVIIANEIARKALKIPISAKLGKHISYYCNQSLTNPIAELIENTLKTQVSNVEKISILQNSELRDWLCNVFMLRNITGQIKGVFFVGVDITEELGKNKLSNWAMLAHDMQTNLSIIQMNTEMLEIINTEENLSRKQRIINQTKLLINRVKDLVTVGKSNKLNKAKTLTTDICNELMNEFNKIDFPNIDFKIDIQEFYFYCDKQKLLRALRNAVDNSIKSFKNNNGEIKIKCWKDNEYVHFSIKDNGPGMDEQTKTKIINPYLNTGESKGGSGIGTMIMQFVVDLHKGDLKINSEVGKGTEVIFSIPLY